MRLELEKKLAASSQKFAEAAKLSAELKALAAKLDGDVATRQQALHPTHVKRHVTSRHVLRRVTY